MKILKIIFSISIFSILSSCASPDKFLTEQKDGWFRDSELGLVYCRANAQNAGSADPVCFEAGFVKNEKK
jgi:hypothetical protein